MSGEHDSKKIAWHAQRCIAYMDEVARLNQRLNAREERIRELEGALEDILAYVTVETPAVVVEIINGVLNKEEE